MNNPIISYVNQQKNYYSLDFVNDWFAITKNCLKVIEAEGNKPKISLCESNTILERPYSIWAGSTCELAGPDDLNWKPRRANSPNAVPIQKVKLKEIRNICVINWHNHIFVLKDGEVIVPISHRRWPILFSELGNASKIFELETNSRYSLDTAFIAHSDTPHDVFGHFIMDYLPQYSFCQDLPFPSLDIVCPKNTKVFHPEFMELVVSGKQWNLSSISHGESINIKNAYYVETPPERNAYTFYRASSWAIDYFRQLGVNAQLPLIPNGDILFIDKPNRRRILNNSDLVSALTTKGRSVTRIYLEEYNVPEKIALFAAHRHLLSVHSSAPAMMPFLGSHINESSTKKAFSELCPYGFSLPIFPMISNRLGIRHQVFNLPPQQSNNNPMIDDLTVDVQYISERLIDLL